MYFARMSRSAFLLAAFALAACTHDDAKPQQEAAAPSASETAFPSGTPLDKPLVRSQPVRPRFPCRAIEATNKPMLLPSPVAPIAAGDAGASLLARDMQIPEGDWIDLAAGAKVTAKSPRTLRETAFEGPGRVRPCVDQDEEAWLTAGTFTAVSPGNESPGAEEWMVTSLGVIRYTSASLTAKVDKRSVGLKVNGGTAFVLAEPYASVKDGSDAGPSPADAGAPQWLRADAIYTATLAATIADDKIPAAAVDACKASAATTKTLAAELMAPDASIATLGGAHTDSRRLSRALCSVARLAVAKMADDKPGAPKTAGSKSGLEDAVAAAEKDWRTLP